jgi:hypothetical protein
MDPVCGVGRYREGVQDIDRYIKGAHVLALIFLPTILNTSRVNHRSYLNQLAQPT